MCVYIQNVGIFLLLKLAVFAYWSVQLSLNHPLSLFAPAYLVKKDIAYHQGSCKSTYCGNKGATLRVHINFVHFIFSGFFSLAEWGGIPPSPPLPITENHCAQKPCAELGGTPPPLTEKIG